MPFERIKPPKLHAVIGTLIGIAIGVIIAKGNKAVLETTNALNKEGCPDEKGVAKLKKKSQALQGLSGNLASSMAKFASLPPKILIPVAALEIAIDIILAIPVPQALGIPPGPAGGLIIGLPVNTTTKFADTLNILKEFAAALKLSAIAIALCLKGAEGAVSGITARVKDLDAPIRACEIENKLKKTLSLKQAGMLGMLDAEGKYITSTIGMKVLGKPPTDPANVQVKAVLKGLGIDVGVKGSVESLEDFKDKLGLSPSDKDFIKPPLAMRISSGPDKNKLAVVSKDRDIFNDATDSNLLNANDGIIDNDYDIKIVELDTFKQGGLSGRAKALSDLDTALRQMNDKLAVSSGIDSGGDGEDGYGEWILKSGSGKNGAPLTAPPSPTSPFTDIDESIWIWNGGTVTEGLGLTTEELEELRDSIKSISKGLQVATDKPVELDPEYSYLGYELRIVKDPFSPPLAPKHFGIATVDGIQKVRGPSSYSSNKQVLLDELKYRIDEQLIELSRIAADEAALLAQVAQGPTNTKPEKTLAIKGPKKGVISGVVSIKDAPRKKGLLVPKTIKQATEGTNPGLGIPREKIKTLNRDKEVILNKGNSLEPRKAIETPGGSLPRVVTSNKISKIPRQGSLSSVVNKVGEKQNKDRKDKGTYKVEHTRKEEPKKIQAPTQKNTQKEKKTQIPRTKFKMNK